MMLKQRGLAPSRTRAQALIMAGMVLVDGRPVAKAGHPVSPEAEITLKSDPCPYVSRGGLKLEAALDRFAVDARGRICMDVGASTGGFTDCLLKRGARLVYAIDVGYGQLDWGLRNRQEVIALEKTNIRTMNSSSLDPVPDLAVVDTSFISLRLVIPRVIELIQPRGDIIALIKPQFEAGPKNVGKGGIIRDPKVHDQVLKDLANFFTVELGLSASGIIPSPILGAKGNREFLIHLEKDA